MSNHSSSDYTVAPTTPTSSLLFSNLFSLQGRGGVDSSNNNSNASAGDVDQKVVLITGGGSGIGAYTAIGLALNGCRVYVVGRRQAKLEKVRDEYAKRVSDLSSEEAKGAGKGNIVPLTADVSSKGGIEQLVVDFMQKGEDRLDVLINGAGVLTKVGLGPEDKNDGECCVCAAVLIGCMERRGTIARQQD